MTRILILTLAILAATVLAKAAAAQECEHVDVMHDRLLSVQGKRLAYSGLLRSGRAYVEIWLREETGEWSAISIRPDDLACLSADGEFWQDWRAQPPGVPG